MIRRSSSSSSSSSSSPKLLRNAAEKTPHTESEDAQLTFLKALDDLKQEANSISTHTLRQRVMTLTSEVSDLFQLEYLFATAEELLVQRGGVAAPVLTRLMVRLVEVMDIPSAPGDKRFVQQDFAERVLELMAHRLGICPEAEQLMVVDACISSCRKLGHAERTTDALTVFTSALRETTVSVKARKALEAAKPGI